MTRSLLALSLVLVAGCSGASPEQACEQSGSDLADWQCTACPDSASWCPGGVPQYDAGACSGLSTAEADALRRYRECSVECYEQVQTSGGDVCEPAASAPWFGEWAACHEACRSR